MTTLLLGPCLVPPGAPPQPRNDAVAMLAGPAAHAVVPGGGHRWLVGVSPLR